MTDILLRPIGLITTPFSQKFGIPRQSQALSKAKGHIQFDAHINPQNACRGLEQFSHLWLSFIFHENIDAGFSDTVRPPRLGGNDRIGVFASRSTFRPNPIGLSLVRNRGLNDKNHLIVEGVDLLNQTPIIDIKPYIAYADNPAGFTSQTMESVFSGYAENTPDTVKVLIDDKLKKQLSKIEIDKPGFLELLINVLEQDPRPAYRKSKTDEKTYTIRLYNYDITWTARTGSIHVSAIWSE
jgi:tRNA-Thr(GGU) m(6)t(6)A37 methyltransferase TsaA